ncbi:hypothetical protein [Stenotrophomonas sp. NPDC078853]|uniref:hypothetical protein n=1 Tax=Stenotrophomonas sp. NPDC078853 TaxID=3364534 RepID=UPI00385159A1
MNAQIDTTDPWRGLYAVERLPQRCEYGELIHPDLPTWPDDREEALDKLVSAQGFDFVVVAGDFTDEALENGDELYWEEMRAWNPEAPEGDWRLAWMGDTEDGPYAWFVRPMALRPEVVDFQAGVAEWARKCFDASLYRNMTERGDRLLEEVLELLQSKGYDSVRVRTLVNYVYGRPVGEPAQEVGGVMVTLAAFCSVAGLNMKDAGAVELARIAQPEVMDKIRRKQALKNALHFDTPLPGSAARQPMWQEPVGEIDESEDGRFVELYQDHEMPLGAKVYLYPPAQAVDLGQLSAHNIAALQDMREHMAAGTLSLNDWSGFGTAALDAVLALIDSGKAAGNG